MAPSLTFAEMVIRYKYPGPRRDHIMPSWHCLGSMVQYTAAKNCLAISALNPNPVPLTAFLRLRNGTSQPTVEMEMESLTNVIRFFRICVYGLTPIMME